MRYIISYDLMSSEKDYDSLFEAIKKIGGKRVLQSQWGVVHESTTPKALCDHFKRLIDSNYRLLVTCIDTTFWASWNLKFDLDSI